MTLTAEDGLEGGNYGQPVSVTVDATQAVNTAQLKLLPSIQIEVNSPADLRLFIVALPARPSPATDDFIIKKAAGVYANGCRYAYRAPVTGFSSPSGPVPEHDARFSVDATTNVVSSRFCAGPYTATVKTLTGVTLATTMFTVP